MTSDKPPTANPDVSGDAVGETPSNPANGLSVDGGTAWQPIETAPRDGTDVHVIRANRWLCPVPAYFVSAEYLEREYGDPEYMETGWYPSFLFLFDLPEVTLEPTHWQPLPTPPEAS